MPTQTRLKKQNNSSEKKQKTIYESLLFNDADTLKKESKKLKGGDNTEMVQDLSQSSALNIQTKSKNSPVKTSSKKALVQGTLKKTEKGSKQTSPNSKILPKKRTYLEQNSKKELAKDASKSPKGKQLVQTKFTPRDKIEVSQPRAQGSSIPKSVREPNPRPFQSDAVEDIQSDIPNMKRQRTEAIQKLKSKTARIVAQDTRMRPIDVDDEKPRELTKRTLNSPKKYEKANPLFQKAQEKRQQRKLQRPVFIDPNQTKERPTISRSTAMALKQEAVKELTKLADISMKNKQAQFDPIKVDNDVQSKPPKRSLEEKAEKAKCTVDEFLLFEQDNDSELQVQVKKESRQSNPCLKQENPVKIEDVVKAERAKSIQKSQKSSQQSSQISMLLLKESQSSIQILLEQGLEAYKLKEERKMLRKHPQSYEGKGKRGEKQARKQKWKSELEVIQEECPERQRVIESKEGKAIQRIINKIRARIDDPEDLLRFSTKSKGFLRYLESFVKRY